MKILHINTTDVGGAANAAQNLHKNFIQAGYFSKFLVLYKTLDEDNIIGYPYKLIFKTRIINLIERKFKTKSLRLDPNYCFFNINERKSLVSASHILKAAKFIPDIIILHWTSNFLNSKIIYELNILSKAPIFWYIMDMAPFTGGCHYAWNCKGYTIECGSCPALFSTDPHDISFINLKEKKKYLGRTNLIVISPSLEVTNQVKKSSVFKNKYTEQIMLSINDKVFKPGEKVSCRNNLLLPIEKKIIFFGATNLNEPRKGGIQLVKALQILWDSLSNNISIRDEILLLIAGNDQNSFIDIPFEKKYLGFLKGEKLLASAYKSADIFVCPSIEDSGPMMVNESIMSGTPVVSFNIGISLDLVNEQTGYKAELDNSYDLAMGMLKILNLTGEEFNKISNNCRQVGLNKLHPQVQLTKFIDLFKKALSKN